LVLFFIWKISWSAPPGKKKPTSASRVTIRSEREIEFVDEPGVPLTNY
jgi:hypothetical protein